MRNLSFFMTRVLPSAYFLRSLILLYAFISKGIHDWVEAGPLEVRAAGVGVVDSGGVVGARSLCGGAGAGISLGP